VSGPSDKAQSAARLYSAFLKTWPGISFQTRGYMRLIVEVPDTKHLAKRVISRAADVGCHAPPRAVTTTRRQDAPLIEIK
jgi:hypothetical protein